MKTQRKQGWMLQMAVAIFVAVAALAGVPVSAHDFGGTSTPNPPPDNPPDDPCKYKCCDGPGGPPFTGPNVGKPVDLLSGAERFTVTDLTINSLFPIEVRRRYDSSSTFDTALGFGWSFAFDRRLFKYPDGSVVLRTGCGLRERFIASGGVYVTPRDGTQGTLVENGDGSFDFRYYDGTRDLFDADGRLLAEENRAGHRHEFLYDARGKLPLTGTSPFSVDPNQPMVVAYLPRMTRMQERSADGQLTGYAIDFAYDENTGRLAAVTGNDGREVEYRHDVTGGTLTRGNLIQVDGLGDLFYLYKYEDPNDAHKATWIQVGQSGTPVLNTYDAKGRVTQQTQGATQLTFAYVASRIQTNVTRKIYDDQGVLLYTNQSRYYFDEAGYLTSEVNPAGYEMKSFYTANKDLERVEWRRTANGTIEKWEAYTFDGSGHKLTQRVTLAAADGGETITRTWTYDHDWISSEQVVSDADATKVFRTEYTFLRDANQVPVAIASVKRRNDDGSFATTTYSYCTASDVSSPNSTCPYLRLLKAVDGPRTDVSDVATYLYYPSTDESGCSIPPAGACHRKGQPWKMTNALGHVVEYLRYDQAGNVTRLLDSNQVVTDFERDARGRLLARKLRGPDDGVETDDAITRFVYDDRGDMTRMTQADGSAIDYTYDGRSRLTDVQDSLSNGVHYRLDSEGNRLREDTTDPVDTLTRTSSQSFDNLGRRRQAKNAGGQATTFTYDVRGNMATALDPLNRTTTQSYDSLDRLTKTVQDSAAGGIQATTKFTYDAMGNLRKVVDPDNLTTEYVYDARGQLTRLVSPDTGTTTYDYDAAGNRVSQTDNRTPSVTSTYTYDALNRLTGIAYPTSSLNVTYAYDQSNVVTGCASSFPLGRLTRMTDATGNTTYCYDRRGNVTSKTQGRAGINLRTEYTYDAADRLRSMTYPSGAIVTIGRDVLGRVESVSWQSDANATPQSLIGNATWYPFGPLNELSFGNGRTLTKTYDQDYVIDRIHGAPAGVLTLDFGVDAMGNITSASGTLGLTPPDRIYGYDALYRLKTSQSGGGSPLESYTYNKTGDRTSASLGGAPASAYTYAAGTHRLASVGSVNRTYDGNGNTLSGTSPGLTLSYDDRNRFARATNGSASTNYAINGRGERVGKTNAIARPPTGTTVYAYDEGGQLIGEYSGTGAVQVEYIYLDSIPVGVVRGGALYYIETDHLGTPRQVVKPSGNVVVWKWDFLQNAFGNSAPDEDPDGDAVAFVLGMRFPGQYYDAETGLNYNYQRNYEPSTGRYIESDPIGLWGGINTYGYVGAKPLQFMDPTGETAAAGTLPWTWSEPVWKPAWRLCLAVAANPVVAAIVVGSLPNSTSACDQPDPNPDAGCKKCPECSPPTGTLCFDANPHVGTHGTGRNDPHYHVFVMRQNPKDCSCHWNAVGDFTIGYPAPMDMMPCPFNKPSPRGSR